MPSRVIDNGESCRGHGAALHDTYRRRFGSLWALGVAAWTASVRSLPLRGDDGRWSGPKRPAPPGCGSC